MHVKLALYARACKLPLANMQTECHVTVTKTVNLKLTGCLLGPGRLRVFLFFFFFFFTTEKDFLL